MAAQHGPWPSGASSAKGMLHKERWSTSSHDTLPWVEMAMKYAGDLYFDGLRAEVSLARRDMEESLY